MRCFFGLVLLGFATLLPAQEQGKTGVPLEVEPKDSKLTRIVLVAGVNTAKTGEHEYFAGTVLLANLLKQTPGVFPVIARDGWPKNPKIFEGAKAVMFYSDGGGAQLHLKADRMAEVQKLMDAGVGMVHLHGVVDYPETSGERVLPWLGAFWDKKMSCRGHWIADIKDFPQHPITRGVQPFRIDDGWLFNLHFLPDMKGITPLVKIVPPEKMRSTADAKKYPGRPETVGWAYERPNGGRTFAFTGGHLHSNWGDENLRRFIINGILWSAHVEIPEGGARVALDPEELKKNMEPRAPKGKK